VVLVDDRGREEKIYRTEKPKTVEDFEIDPKDPLAVRMIKELKKRLQDAKEQKAPLALRKLLLFRIRNLERNRDKLTGPVEAVEENLLKEQDGLLFKARWEWLKAKDKERQYPRNAHWQEEADKASMAVKDFEDFLPPAGWDREKEEWEIDYDSFREKFKRDPPQWVMDPRPDEAPNTEGK
jgi:hypothetical protein